MGPCFISYSDINIQTFHFINAIIPKIAESKKEFNPFIINNNVIFVLTVFYLSFSRLKQVGLSNLIMIRENIVELT
jgi:hypothetical protein